MKYKAIQELQKAIRSPNHSGINYIFKMVFITRVTFRIKDKKLIIHTIMPELRKIGTYHWINKKYVREFPVFWTWIFFQCLNENGGHS